jgi:iron complex outermembrane receptor protein
MYKPFFTALILTAVFVPAVCVNAQDATSTTSASASTALSAVSDKDLLSLDLSDLMNIKVTTASKTAESFNKVAASLYVVTADDIRRSGAQTIPEALRLVPGVDVAQLNSGQYAVSIRGFNSSFSDKLLVLVDGRTIYNNLYGGVFWEDQQTPMADIDRIEVVRGPGTATWGANAVQGIINIITKSAKDTQGWLASAEYGDHEDKDQEIVRFGAKLGNDSFVRIFGESTDRSDGLNPSGTHSPDAWTDSNGGFRFDKGDDNIGKLQVSGDIFRNVNTTTGGSEDTTFPYFKSYPTTAPDTGGDLLAHWEKLQGNGSTLAFQADYTDTIHYLQPVVKDAVNIENFDFQDSLAPKGSSSIIFGLGYKNTSSNLNGLNYLPIAPATTTVYGSTEKSISGYIQDQISFSKTLSAQIGSKLDNDNYTGWEYEPSAHFGYTPDDRHTLWVSASRAVELPSLDEVGFTDGVNVGGEIFPPTTLITEVLKGHSGFDSQVIAAYEAGYRVQATDKILFDLSTFYNQYSQLVGLAGTGSPMPYAGPPAGLEVPLILSEIGSGDTYGGELATHVRFTPDWRVNFGYSYLYAHIPFAQELDGVDEPNSQTEIQSYYNFNKKTEFDSAVYFVGANKEESVGSYTKLDLRLGYNPSKSTELSIGGNNLLSNSYAQFGSSFPANSYQVQREFYTKISWKY